MSNRYQHLGAGYLQEVRQALERHRQKSTAPPAQVAK